MTSFRDQVRLRAPRLLRFYQRKVAPRFGRDDRQLALARWATEGPPLIQRLGTHGIRFEGDGTWIDDGGGFLWLYEPERLSTAFGADLGLRYESEEIDLLAELLPEDGLLIDVGANVGLHSIQLARRVRGLNVIAFEAVAATYEMFLANIEKNLVTGAIAPHHVALQEESGTVRLTTGFQVGNFIVPEGTGAAQTEEVRAEPLDGLLTDRPQRVNAIKCDVEGAELGVLRGARALIENDRPDILLEIDQKLAPRYGNTGEDVVAFLAALGYGYETFRDGELRVPGPDLAADLATPGNFLFRAS